MNPFRGLTTRADVARLLGTSTAQLNFLLRVRPEPQRYTEFRIAKRRGGERIILAPREELKFLQSKLVQEMSEVYRPPSPVHGFVAGRSIVTNAKNHVGRRFVLNVDLRDFFPSIHFGRVRGLFLSSAFGANGQAAIVLAQICCHQKSLPAGAPTSPLIANMICAKLDRELVKLAKKHGCRYSRYADDITFSKQYHAFPPEVAYFGLGHAAVVGEDLRTVIESNGFMVHPQKVKLFRNVYRQEVTGLVVNEKVNLQRRFIRQLRAMLHAWKKHGAIRAEQEFHSLYWLRRSLQSEAPPFSAVVRGKIEFVKMVRGIGDPVYRNLQRMLLEVDPGYFAVMEQENSTMTSRDVFISHASEDKHAFVGPLTHALIGAGLTVWYDEFEIQVGDSIRRKIDEGLSRSKYGVVVLSPSFFGVGKNWPQRELDGLVSTEDATGAQRILPVWHDIDFMEVQKRSPMLAGLLALKSSEATATLIAAKIATKVLK